MNKKAFTLIELLVVVLIIGVLAAVALPQYQTAINKSRYAGLMPLAKSVKDAEEEVFMTKADYTAVLEDLAVMSGTIDEGHPNTATNGNVTLSVVAGASEGQDYVKAVDNRNTDNTFIMYFAKSPVYAGEIHCEAKTSNAKAQQLCKSYGPVGTITNGADTTGTFTTYVLQGTGKNAEQSGGGGSNNTGEVVDWNCQTNKNGTRCSGIDAQGNVVSYYGYNGDSNEAQYDSNGNANFLASCWGYENQNEDHSCAEYTSMYERIGDSDNWRICTSINGTTCDVWNWGYNDETYHCDCEGADVFESGAGGISCSCEHYE